MNKIQKISAITITTVIFLILFSIFAFNIASISVPKDSIKFQTEKLQDTVYVYKNSFGIPHIISKNENDTYFILGYLHAQNKLWLIDFFRRLAYGELSEIFGSQTLDLDLFLRTLDIKATAKNTYLKSPKKLQKIIESYSNGINYFIQQNSNKLSYEFALLDCSPKQWQPQDCYAVSKFLALYYSSSFHLDMLFAEIATKVNIDSLQYFLPPSFHNSPCILDDSTFAPTKTISTKKSDTTTQSLIQYNLLEHTIQNFSNTLSHFNNILPFSQPIGSTAWAIRKDKINKKGAILASDSHHPFCLPTLWYPIIISSPSTNLIGVTLPGIPFPFYGRTSDISWAFVNANVDNVDYFIEKIAPNDTNYYLLSTGEKKQINFIPDTIKILDQPPLIYYKKHFNNSFSITTTSSNFNAFLPNFKKIEKDYALTFKWTGKESSNELNALYKIISTKNFSEFKKALSEWGSPTSTFVYCDKFNNIGAVIAGYIPIRNQNCNPYLPNPTWIEKQLWTKNINASYYYSIQNPAKQYIIAANIPFKQKDTNNIVFCNTLPARAIRIDSILNQNSYNTVQDMKFIQNEYHSYFAKEFLHNTIPILEKEINKLSEDEKSILYLLKRWNYILSPRSVEATIYITLLKKCFENLFKPKLSQELFQKYTTFTTLIYANIYKHLIYQNTTKNTQILIKSYKEAISYLQENYPNQKWYEWTYEKINQIRLYNFAELIGSTKLKTFEEYYKLGGDITTINYNQLNFSDLPIPNITSTMRFITDMQDTTVHIILVGGTNNDILSPNYNDQTQLWLNGGYISLPLTNRPDEKFKLFISAFPK